MAVSPTPAGYTRVTPYLLVDGIGEVVAFLKSAFEAVEVLRLKRPDGSIMHAEVRIGEDCDAAYERALRSGGAR